MNWFLINFVTWVGLLSLWTYFDWKVFRKPYIIKNLFTANVFWIPTIVGVFYDGWLTIFLSVGVMVIYIILYFCFLRKHLLKIDEYIHRKYFRKRGEYELY